MIAMGENLNEHYVEELVKNLLSWSMEKLPGVLVLIFGFFVLMRVVRFLLGRFRKGLLEKVETEKDQRVDKEKRVTTIFGIIRGVCVVALWTMFLMILLKQIGVDIAPILAGAGIVGLAVGFGAQELVRDAISGFFLILENRVRVGDVAIVNGTGGLVEHINLRTITLRDLSGVVHTYQNGKIDTLANMTKDWSAMVFDIGIAYKEDVDQVLPIVHELGAELREDEEFGALILEPIEVFGLDKFGDSAVIIKARIKTDQGQQWTIGREFNRRMKAKFDELGIEIPFPHRTIYWGDDIAPLKLSKE